MASTAFDSFLYDVATGAIDLDTDMFNVLLVTSDYAEDKIAHDKREDVTNEVTGAGYTSGGKAVTVSVTKDTTNHRITISLGGTTWTGSTLTARKAVYFKSRGGAASADELVAVNDFGSDKTTENGTFTLNASTIHINTPVVI